MSGLFRYYARLESKTAERRFLFLMREYKIDDSLRCRPVVSDRINRWRFCNDTPERYLHRPELVHLSKIPENLPVHVEVVAGQHRYPENRPSSAPFVSKLRQEHHITKVYKNRRPLTVPSLHLILWVCRISRSCSDRWTGRGRTSIPNLCVRHSLRFYLRSA
jgi:hypothetical protein